MEDWAEIRRLHRAEGMPVWAIARKLGMGRNTVRRALAAEGPPKYQRRAKGSIADAADPRIRELLAQWPDMPATVIAEGGSAGRGLDDAEDGRLRSELTRLGRVPLLVVDEVGYWAGQQFAGRPDGVDRVALARPALPDVAAAVDLRHVLALGGEVAGQAQPIVPGSLNGPVHRAAPAADRAQASSCTYPAVVAGTCSCVTTRPRASQIAAVCVSRWVSTPTTRSA